MLHILKEVLTKYGKRIKGLLRFIFDYKVLLFSITYMLFTYFGVNLLRNIGQRGTMGLFFLLGIAFCFFLLKILLLRNMAKTTASQDSLKNSVQKYVHFFVLCISFVFVGIFVLVRILPIVEAEKHLEQSYPSFTNEEVMFEAYIAEEPDKRYRNQQLQLRQLQDIVVEEESLPKNHGNILTRVENYRKFSIGQVCTFRGELVEPENFDDFDYKTFLKNQKVFYILENPSYTCVDITEKRAGNPIRNHLFDLKESILVRIDQTLHEPYSSLLAGILFGKRRRLETDFAENIRMAGIGHVITASGYNITILIIMINKLLFFLPKKAKVITCLLLIWVFAVFTGLTNSIIRACIMNTLSLVALLFGRDSRIHISLPLASAIFVFLDPLIILNVGFLLSISAILGLVYVSPILISAKKFLFKAKLKFLDDYIFPTLSCTIGILPISIQTFETFTIWSVPVNAVVLPAIESTMLWGVISLLTSSIHKPLSDLFFTTVNLQLKYLEYIVNRVGQTGYGSWEINPAISGYIALLLFFSITLFLIYFYPIENERYNHYLKNN